MLVDSQIERLGRGIHPVITPLLKSSLRPFSLEIHAGRELLFGAPHTDMTFPNIRKFAFNKYHRPRSWAAIDLDAYSERDSWSLKPGWLALIKTAETFRFPPTLIAQVALSPEAVVNGYGLTSPQWFGAGFEGKLTLAIMNHNSWIDAPVYPGLPIAHLHFERLRKAPRGTAMKQPNLGIVMDQDLKVAVARWEDQVAQACGVVQSKEELLLDE